MCVWMFQIKKKIRCNKVKVGWKNEEEEEEIIRNNQQDNCVMAKNG